MAQQSDRQHVNILVLPSQTGLIVLMMVLVMLGIMVAFSLSTPALWFLLLAIVVPLIALRGLLGWPDHCCRVLRLRPSERLEFDRLESVIQDLSQQIGLPRVPRLMLSPYPVPIHTFGSIRRWYIAVGKERAQRFEGLLADEHQRPTIEAAILHELYHFKHRDHLWLGLARSLLFRGGWLLLWFGLLMVGLFVLLMLIQQSFFEYYSPNRLQVLFDQIVPGSGAEIAEALVGSQADWERLREQMDNTNPGVVIFSVLTNTLSLAVFGAVVLPTLWRALLLLREVYADAGAAQVQGRIGPLLESVIQASAAADAAPGAVLSGNLARLVNLFGPLWSGLHRLYRWLNRSSLQYLDRIKFLHRPQRLYDGWWNSGILIGALVVGINVLLSGTAALLFIGDWPLHFPVLVAALLLNSTLILPIAMGYPVRKQITRTVAVIVGIHTLILSISLCIIIIEALFAPETLVVMVEVWVRGLTWYTTVSDDMVVQDPRAFAIEASIVNLLQIPAQLLMILLLVAVHVWLTRRILTWYSFPQAAPWLVRIIQWLIWLELAVVGLVLLPPLTDLVVLRGMQSFVSARYWAVAAMTLCIAAGVAIRLLLWDRAYARRCPACRAVVPGAYVVGRRCATCDTLLHPWLISAYDTEPYR